MDFTTVRGFNYQPSFGSSGFEIWRQFDAGTVRTELGRGKQYFPRMNAIRLWLSWDAYLRDPQVFSDRFETALQIAASYDLLVMPVLFNRWHTGVLDWGGIYLDHFLPRSSWVQRPALFEPYMEAIVGAHARDERIFAWDLCNEPFSYGAAIAELPQYAEPELAWLTGIRDGCKSRGTQAPITIGIHPGVPLELVDPIVDLHSIHPYWGPNIGGTQTGYERKLDDECAFAEKVGKPILATETCWGSLNDAERVEIVRYTLTQLNQRRIGWTAYLLHHSLIADAHRPEFGPIGEPGNLAFIEADGSLRPGHEIINEFM